MKANVIVFEAIVFIFFLVFYQGAKRALGKSRNRAFLGGAILFALAIETAAVIGGVKNFYWYASNNYYSHYPLGGYIIWLGLVPLAAMLLWYMVTASAYMTVVTVMPKRSIASRSAVAGAIAVGFYLLIEPVAITNHWWTWNLKSFYVIDIPLVGLVAVFVSVFLYLYNYHYTLVDTLDLKRLKWVEDRTIRRWPLKSKQLTRNLRWEQLLYVYLMRLLGCFVVFAVAIAPVILVFWLIANRGHIPPGW